jgi:hypothetical protein
MPDYAGDTFAVEKIQHYTTAADGQLFHYTAYDATTPDGRRLQLRVDQAAGQVALLALHLHDEMEYSRELYDIVETDRTGIFQITNDDTGEVTAEYNRPDGVLSAFQAVVATETGDTAAPATRKLQYWDYSRQMENGAEFLIVEMESTGHFRIVLGPEIAVSSFARV